MNTNYPDFIVCEHCINQTNNLGRVDFCEHSNNEFSLIDNNTAISYFPLWYESNQQYLHPNLGKVLVLPVKKFENDIVYHGTYIEYVYNIFWHGFLSKEETGICSNGFLSEEWLRYLTESWSLASNHCKEKGGVILPFKLQGYVLITELKSYDKELKFVLEQLNESFIGLEFLEQGKKTYALRRNLKIRPTLNKYTFKLLINSIWLRFSYKIRKLTQ